MAKLTRVNSSTLETTPEYALSRVTQSMLNGMCARPEMFKLDGDVDDTASFQRAALYCVNNSVNFVADGHYLLSGTIVFPEVQPAAAVRNNFSRLRAKINGVKYTASAGNCFEVKSPCVLFDINDLEGTSSFTVPNQTVGVMFAGNGSHANRIGRVHGFASNVLFEGAFSHSLTVGYCYNALRGVVLTTSNAIRLFGRIGAGFTDFDVPVDPTSLDIGVVIGSDCTSNEIYANIEYCKRSSESRPILDQGHATKYYGYIESCSKSAQFVGLLGDHEVKFNSNNILNSYGVEVDGLANVVTTTAFQLCDGKPFDAAGVIPFLTYWNLQAMQSNAHSRVQGELLHEYARRVKVNNFVRYSNNLTGPSWSKNHLGGATDDTLTFTQLVSTGRYMYGTNLSLPSVNGDQNKVYLYSQVFRAAFIKDISLGIAVECLNGDADVMIKMQSNTTNKVYYRAFRILGGSKVHEVHLSCPTAYVEEDDYTLSIQVRPWKATSLNICNTHVCNAADVRRAPSSVDGGLTPFVPESDVPNATKKRCKGVGNITLTQYDFDIYPITAGPVTLSDGGEDTFITLCNQAGSVINLFSPTGALPGNTSSRQMQVGEVLHLSFGDGKWWLA